MSQAKARRPKGPTQLPLVGNSLAFGRDPHGFLLKAAAFGPITSLQLFFRPFYLLSSAELIQQGLVHRSRSTRKDDMFDLIRRALGNGLATSENPLWRRQRKLMAPVFTPAHVSRYGDKMVEAARGTLNQWSNGQTIDLYEMTAEIALEAVSNAMFGVSVRREANDVFRSMTAISEFFVEALTSPVPLPPWWPSPRNFRFVRACKQMDHVVEQIIDQRRNSGDDHGDLLSTLLHSVDENGDRLSDRQIRDECMTVLVAGHETSGLALMYTLYLLARHPDYDRRVREELRAVLNGRSATSADLENLPLTTQAIKEALRLYPPGWITARVLTEDAEVGGYSLKKGSSLIFSPWVTHRDPDVFPNPNTFDPDRWSPERAKDIPKFAFFPFGAGPRSCIGQHFAMMELGLIVATLVQRCSFELVSPEVVRLGVSVTLTPASEVLARVRLRKGVRVPPRRSSVRVPRPPVRVPTQRPPTGKRPSVPIAATPRRRQPNANASSEACPFHSAGDATTTTIVSDADARLSDIPPRDESKLSDVPPAR